MNLTPSDALSGVVRSTVDTAHGKVQFRRAGMAPQVTHVLLHGIGSASASWASSTGTSTIQVRPSGVGLSKWVKPPSSPHTRMCCTGVACMASGQQRKPDSKSREALLSE